MMENSRFLIIIFYFEGKKKEINTNLRCFFSLRLLSPVPTPAIRLGVFSVIQIPLLISTHCLCSQTTAQALDPVF